MKILANDKVSKLFLAYRVKLIKQDDLIFLVNSQKINLGSHLNWTLEQFSTLTDFRNDIEVVKYILQLEKQKLSWIKRIFFKDNILKLKVKRYLEILKFVKDGIDDINGAILKIRQPKMSAEMIQAGFNKLDFGDLGIARTIGEFEHIGTIQAYGLQMHVIIKSLDQLAAIKRCEKSHTEILEAQNKQKYRG